MALNIVVLAKQVIDPEMPASAFQVDRERNRVVIPGNIPPVVNGFDENAVEAALQIKDTQEAVITVISMGKAFAMDVMKKPLSMGADELILVDDESFDNSVDSYATAQVLAAAVRKHRRLRPGHLRAPGVGLGHRPGPPGCGGDPGDRLHYHR